MYASMDQNNKIIPCSFEQHADAILAIFNDAILHSTALYEYQERSLHQIKDWFLAKQAAHFPVIGIENTAGELMGFASYGMFRAFPANQFTVEHSIYVDQAYRGQGLGRILLEAIIAEAKNNNMHVMIGGIDATNQGSIILHEKLGFEHAGTLKEVAFKFDRWLDLAFYQLILSDGLNPHKNIC